MAKIFITEGTGSSQVLNESDSNKLKVYDSYDDIDTTELVDGEIVSTKETATDGSNVYDYINEMLTKENLLSEYEAITLPTSAATAMTMPYDGIVVVAGTTSGIASVYVNGVQIAPMGNNTTYSGVTIPFRKGDTVYRSAVSNLIEHVAYYKQRYYGGRQ